MNGIMQRVIKSLISTGHLSLFGVKTYPGLLLARVVECDGNVIVLETRSENDGVITGLKLLPLHHIGEIDMRPMAYSQHGNPDEFVRSPYHHSHPDFAAPPEHQAPRGQDEPDDGKEKARC